MTADKRRIGSCPKLPSSCRDQSVSKILVLATVLSLLLTGTTFAMPQGISLSLAPGADYLYWDRELGLRDVALYGGRLALNFGRLVSLQGHYMTNETVDTDLGSLRFDGAPIPFDHDQELQLNRFGADLIFNLGGQQGFVPFLKVSGGVMQFRPQESPDFDAIAFGAGGGMRFAFLRRLQAQIYIEDLMFRMDRSVLVPGAVIADPDRNDIRHNLSVGGNILFHLGGQSADEETDLDRAVRSRYEAGLFGASWPIELMVGNVKFDNRVGLGDQAHAGVRTGLNFGQLLGLRGYYWRGISDDFDDTSPIQSYGGEAQFNLNSGMGAIPYLVLGMGQLDFLDEYRDESGGLRSDKTMLIAGGGLGFSLGRHLRVNASARDFIFSETDHGQLADPGELLHNWSFAAGITFILGGKSSDRREIDALGRERWTSGDAAAAPATGRTPRSDTTAITEFIVLPDSQGIVRTYQGDRVVAIPVPEVGEIYVRYGQPGGVMIKSEAEPKSSSAVDAAKTAPPTKDPTRSTLPEQDRMETLARDLEERLGERLERRIDEKFEKIGIQSKDSEGKTVIIAPETSSSSTTVITTGERNVFHTYTGFNVGDPSQLLLGARLDLGSIANNRSLRFMPELVFGFFNEGSFMLAGNAKYQFGMFPGTSDIAPYAYAGLGIIRFGEGVDRDQTEGVLNIGYGISKPIGRWIGFLEHQGVDLFSLNRIIAGIRWTKK